jgi:transglutaminase-like putative cysteine protease
MKRIKITHQTEYLYKVPVTLLPHRALVRPREGHDVHIESSRLVISPHAGVRWLRDIYGNSIAMLEFYEQTDRLSVLSEVVVNHFDEYPLDFLIDPEAISYPFLYSMEEEAELIPYRLASFPRDGAQLRDWLSDLYTPGKLINTFELLSSLNTRIHEKFLYMRREESGVQTPAETIGLGSGSCRDYAVFMMESARQWGFGARFVTGYIQMNEGQHGSTHAWTEIYIPGAGWRGFDPTNDKVAGAEHVSVAVARDPEKASPLSGLWQGPRDAFNGMNVSVEVVQV